MLIRNNFKTNFSINSFEKYTKPNQTIQHISENYFKTIYSINQIINVTIYTVFLMGRIIFSYT